RQGGTSTGLYASLNGGQGSRDNAAAVAENRARIGAHLAAGPLVSVAQVHSDRVVPVTAPWDGPRPEADAMVTDRPGLALGVLVADCAPVLMADAEAGVVGAAHAGWKGAFAGVLEATVDAMAALGADAGRIVAIVGPCISQRAYEVGPEFVERFLDEDPETARFFAGGTADRAQFDLPGYALARLSAAGVAEAAWTGHCTYADEARFYSYRRATHRGEADYGRLVAAIAVPA
ncbi:MAG: peptidoglycan editing factor PgeF, partial [Pseudomonadota bacterium]